NGLNVLLPTGVIGDLVQIGAVVDRPGLSYARAFASVIADRILGLLALLIPAWGILLLLGARSGMITIVFASIALTCLIINLMILTIKKIGRARTSGYFGNVANFFWRAISAAGVFRHHMLTTLMVLLLGALAALVMAMALRAIGSTIGDIPL